jgi:hypothetical protein
MVGIVMGEGKKKKVVGMSWMQRINGMELVGPVHLGSPMFVIRQTQDAKTACCTET